MWVVALGYLVGSLLGGRLYEWMSGENLSRTGSGNTGARNAFRMGGVKAFLIVYSFDLFKTVFILSFSNGFFWETALALTIGHLYPFWRLKSGGKGYAVFSGIILAYNPLWFIVGLVLLISLIKLMKNSRETGLLMLVMLPLAARGNGLDIGLAIVIMGLIVYHHKRRK